MNKNIEARSTKANVANGRERVLDDIFCKTEDGSVFADKSLGVVLNTLLILLLEKSILVTLSFCRTEIYCSSSSHCGYVSTSFDGINSDSPMNRKDKIKGAHAAIILILRGD